jgi:hypothetical protein
LFDELCFVGVGVVVEDEDGGHDAAP